MTFTQLEQAVGQHAGAFRCRQRSNPSIIKTVPFRHLVTSPVAPVDLPSVGRLDEFYGHFGSIVFYHDDVSGEAARHLVHPADFAQTHADFWDWMEALDEGEMDDFVPSWVTTCLAIGAIPRSGNYILMAMDGPDAGKVFEFDHDGYEFIERASDIVAYVQQLLQPSAALLVDIASSMTFIEPDSSAQWWIEEMHDGLGYMVST